MTRRTLFIAMLLALAWSSTSLAQDETRVSAGSFMIAGSVSFESASSDDGDRSTLIINPEFGYFFADGLEIGAAVLVSATDRDNSSTSELLIGPKAAYYFALPTETIYPFLGVAVLFGAETTEPVLGSDYTDTRTTFEFNGGVMLMVNEHVGINGTLFYRATSIDYDDDTDFRNEANEPITPADSETGIGVSFGLNVFLN